MRPTRDRQPARVALVLVALQAFEVAGCGKEAAVAPAAGPSAPVDLVIGDPSPTPPPVVPAARPARALDEAAAAPDPDPEPVSLPRTWSAPATPGLSFADAMRKARTARDAFERLARAAPSAKEASLKAWFGQAQLLVDQASRMYAGAFHAKDAPREGRVDAIAEAAELDMTMARTLDEQNLGTMPAAWRSDPAVAGTFEDVEVGPTRRWRAEARVLARQCIDTARESNVVTDATRRCAALRTGVRLELVRQAPDAGAGCACSPGDPLCSASLGGWCAAGAP